MAAIAKVDDANNMVLSINTMLHPKIDIETHIMHVNRFTKLRRWDLTNVLCIINDFCSFQYLSYLTCHKDQKLSSVQKMTTVNSSVLANQSANHTLHAIQHGIREVGLRTLYRVVNIQLQILKVRQIFNGVKDILWLVKTSLMLFILSRKSSFFEPQKNLRKQNVRLWNME